MKCAGRLHCRLGAVCAALLLVFAHQAPGQNTYDFSTIAAVDRFAFGDSIPDAIPPTSYAIPANGFLTVDYSAVAVSDDLHHSTSISGGQDRAAVRFVFTIVEQSTDIYQLDVLWEGGTLFGAGPIEVWLWNAVTEAYEFVGSTSTFPPPDAIVSGSFTTNAADFLDAANAVTVLVTQSDDNEGVLTDYVGITITSGACLVDLDCDDFDPCTIDFCDTGLCDNSAVNCSIAGDQCNTASCDPLGVEGNCDTLTPIADGSGCDDLDACNVGETCQLGDCTGGDAPDCSGAGDPCNIASCDPLGTKGNCGTLTPVPNGTPCDDGLACNLGETCQAGVCSGGGPPDCSSTGDDCNAGNLCNSAGAEGNCDLPGGAINLGLPCDDGLFCTLTDICVISWLLRGDGTPGVCVGAGDTCPGLNCDELNDRCYECLADGDCDDNLACTDDSCDGFSACEHLGNCPPGASCNLITGACDLECPDCSVLDDTCNVGVCNVLTGQCEAQPVNEGGDCDNGLLCNEDETCAKGLCVGTLKDCSMLDDACHVGTCDIASGDCLAQPVPEGEPCDDGVDCTFNDACASGVCEGLDSECVSTAPDCQVGFCDHASGSCAFVDFPDGSSCDDGDDCTAVDQCQGGACIGGDVPPPPTGPGCVDVELVVRSGQETIGVGQVVEVDVILRNNDCPPSAIEFACGITLDQQISSVHLPITWNPNVFELLGAFDPCDGTQRTCAGGINDGVACTSDATCEPAGLCACTDSDCGEPGQYDWIVSGFFNDCIAQGDGINFPCDANVPNNDGDVLLEAFAQIECAACLPRIGQLLVSTLRFRALASAPEPEEIRIESCILQTRVQVVGAVDGDAGEITGTIGAVAQVAVEAECLPPLVQAHGPRYIEITPSQGSNPVAFQITGVDPEVACTSGWVSYAGLLGASAAFRTPAEWESVSVRGSGLISGMTYEVRADCSPNQQGLILSDPVAVTLWEWGDNDNNGVINILDITRSIDMFRSSVHIPSVPCTSDLDCSTTPPNFTCDLGAGLCRQVTLDNVDLVGIGCLPDGVVSILDITLIVDSFRSLPNPCTGSCP